VALERRERPPRELETLDVIVRATERVMLGLRLDEALSLDGLTQAIDAHELARLEQLGLAERQNGAVTLTRRGRFLGGAVTASLLA
jgi:coproporphyrinogen III oxidase-like Fe-S oxidoreductase